MLERIDRLLQMAARQMEVDAGGLQVSVAEQHLDRRQVSAVLQQVRGKAMPQHVWADALLDARVPGRIVADMPDGFVGQVLAVRSGLTGKQPRFRLLPSPVFTERFEEPRTERHIAILAALALVNMDDHALTIDVLDAQADQFATSHASGVESHEDGSCLQSACCLDQAGHFVRAQYARGAVMADFG